MHFVNNNSLADAFGLVNSFARATTQKCFAAQLRRPILLAVAIVFADTCKVLDLDVVTSKKLKRSLIEHNHSLKSFLLARIHRVANSGVAATDCDLKSL